MASAELSLPPLVPPQTLVFVPLLMGFCIVFIAAISLLILHILITKLCSDPPSTITSESKKLYDSILIRAYVRDSSGSNDCCLVCLEAFEEGEPVRELHSCQHTFHVPCIHVWLTSHANCPLCRREVEAVTAPQSVALPMEAMGGGDTVPYAESGSDGLIVRSGSSVWPSGGSGVLLSVGEMLRLKPFSPINCFEVSGDVGQGSASSRTEV